MHASSYSRAWLWCSGFRACSVSVPELKVDLRMFIIMFDYKEPINCTSQDMTYNFHVQLPGLPCTTLFNLWLNISRVCGTKLCTSSDIKWFSCGIHHNTCNKTLVSCPDHTLSWGKGSGDQLSSTLWFISFKTKSADSARSRKRPIVTRLFPRGRVGSGYEATLTLNFWCKSSL